MSFGGRVVLEVGDLRPNVMQPRAVFETLVPKTAATGVVSHDILEGTLFLHTSPAADFVCDFTNVPTEEAPRAFVITLIIEQGPSAAYKATGVRINGESVEGSDLLWPGGVEGEAEPDALTYQTFTLLRLSAERWLVTTQLANFQCTNC